MGSRLRLAGTAAAVAALAVLLTVASCHDTRGRIARVEDLMTDQARGIGAATIHIAADDRVSGGTAGQLAHVITALGANLGVRFIAVAGDRGLAVGTPGAETVMAAAPEPAEPDGPPRRYAVRGGTVYEVAAAGVLPDGERVVVRVGLDGAALDALNRDATVRARLRLALGVATAALAAVLLLTLQR
ncbi:MAG TPA: hypothetical protein PLQ13_02000, partial [Candidatus Krumholzibacteria bacterium]|nr:hypothetical protein [Candidatus Krumholzibacteria bacterium]